MRQTKPPATVLSPAVARAVEQLTEDHTVHYAGRELQNSPLLMQLHLAISSSLGVGSGGGGGATDGGLLNVAALTLWEYIDDLARAWMRDFNREHRGGLGTIIKALARSIQAEHANGLIDDDLRERLEAMIVSWVERIEDLFDPPREKQLKGACPECGKQDFIEGDTRHGYAVAIPVKPGRLLVASCRCCNAIWATPAKLVDLADRMGIEVDFDALAELTGSPRYATPEIRVAEQCKSC